MQPHGRGAHFALALGFTISMGPLSQPVDAGLKRTFAAGNVRNVQHFARIAEALAAESAVQERSGGWDGVPLLGADVRCPAGWARVQQMLPRPVRTLLTVFWSVDTPANNRP